MSAVEEHKPVEKRRALGRGLDSLLPAGPRIVSSASAATPAVVPDPVVIPAAAPSIAPPQLTPIPGEIAEIHAGREKSPPKASPSTSLGISAAGSMPAERLNLDGAPSGLTASQAG